MKTCEETHELCSIMIQRFWPLRYGVLWNGGYSLPRTTRGGCIIEALRLFFSRKELCRGWGVCCHTFSFILFSAV